MNKSDVNCYSKVTQHFSSFFTKYFFTLTQVIIWVTTFYFYVSNVESKETILLLDYNFWLLYHLGIKPLLLNFCTELVLTIVLHIFFQSLYNRKSRVREEKVGQRPAAGMIREGLHSG